MNSNAKMAPIMTIFIVMMGAISINYIMSAFRAKA